MQEMITSFDTMPLGVYCRVLDVLEDAARDDLMTQVGLVAALCRCSEQEVLDLPVPDFSERTHKLAFLETPPPENVPDSLQDRITLDGKEYEVHADPEGINTAQFVDYQSLIQQGRSGWPGLVALCVIPAGKAYGHAGPGDPLGYDIKAVRAAIADHMPVATANGIMAFFLRRHVALQKASLTSLTREVRRLPKEARTEILPKIHRAQADLNILTALLNLSDGSTPSSK